MTARYVERSRIQRATIVGLIVALAAVGSEHGAAPAADENVDELVQRMDALWERRDAHGACPDIVALGTLALAVDPHSHAVQWRMARVYFWVAYTQPSRVAKKALAAKAIEWGERARGEQPDRVEGHYFYAVAVGEYASTIGIMQAVVDGVAGKVETAARRAHAIDRDYWHGAPGTVLGRFYFLLPWPKRDLDKSREYLEEVVVRHPRALLARDYLAETYYELGEREKAREQLAFVLANDPEPGTELDRPQPKSVAREAMQRWFQ
jgi:tetratricopeptide (TPR) repeat protein